MANSRAAAAFLFVLLVSATGLATAEGSESIERRQVKLWLPAVGQYENGTLFGVASSLEVVMQKPGSGRVYLSTQPLSELDMQGSARLAVETAASIAGQNTSDVDFFFSVRTSSVTIGGPSAGGAMAVAVVALLMNFTVREDVVMTGMISPDGSIGPIGGLLQKVDAVASVNATAFLIPLGQSQVVVTRTETTRSGSIVTQRTYQETVDIAAYARDRYGIDVEEVADLYDAVPPLTGFQLVRPTPTTDPLQHAAYQNITQRLAENLTAQADGRSAQLSERYEAVKANMSGTQRSDTQEQLAMAVARVRDARDAQNQSKYYLAASFAFQALVALGYAEALITFFEEGGINVSSYTRQYLGETDALLGEINATIRARFPLPAARLDTQGAAEQRYLRALASQEEARDSEADRNYGEALQESSFARERGRSARWWFEIGQEVAQAAPAPVVSETELGALLDRYEETAQLEIEYAALVLGDDPAFQPALDALSDSQSAREQGKLAAGLNDLIDALARTSTALVALGGDDPVRRRLPDLAERAGYQIELAQSQGLPSVYALSLLELGTSQAQSSPPDAYAFYSAARISARANVAAAGIKIPPPQVHPVPPTPPPSGLPADNLSGKLLVVAAYGFITATGAAILIVLWFAFNPRGPKPSMPAWTPQFPTTPFFPPEPPPASPPTAAKRPRRTARRRLPIRRKGQRAR